MSKFGEVSSNNVNSRNIIVPARAWTVGASAPTTQQRGSTPAIDTWGFSDVADSLLTYYAFPDDMELGVNCTLRMHCALAVTELNNDTLDLTLDYNIPQAPGSGAGLAKASTQVTGTTTVTTANGLAADDCYDLDFTLAFGDATNPFSGGSAFAFEFTFTNVTGVGRFNFLGSTLIYEAKY